MNRSFAAASTVMTEEVVVNMKQRATIVRDMERLIVKDRLRIRQLMPPEVKYCDKHNKAYGEDPHVSNACIPVSTGAKDDYWLLWGLDAKEESSSTESTDTEDEEEGSYEKTPLARVYELFQKYVDREFEVDDAANGGALKTLACKVAGDMRCAVDLVIAQLASGKAELRLVYQVCAEKTTFEQLGWILDAGRKPLETLPPAEFEAKYTLPRYLAFKQREPREAVLKDYWGNIYWPPACKRGCRC